MAKAPRKKNWGGKRPGAGRPGEGRVTMCTRVRIEVQKRLKQTAKERKITVSKLMEELLSSAIDPGTTTKRL
jgi:hypothetical protein